jgi:hypothetical protein
MSGSNSYGYPPNQQPAYGYTQNPQGNAAYQPNYQSYPTYSSYQKIISSPTYQPTVSPNPYSQPNYAHPVAPTGGQAPQSSPYPAYNPAAYGPISPAYSQPPIQHSSTPSNAAYQSPPSQIPGFPTAQHPVIETSPPPIPLASKPRIPSLIHHGISSPLQSQSLAVIPTNVNAISYDNSPSNATIPTSTPSPAPVSVSYHVQSNALPGHLTPSHGYLGASHAYPANTQGYPTVVQAYSTVPTATTHNTAISIGQPTSLHQHYSNVPQTKVQSTTPLSVAAHHAPGSGQGHKTQAHPPPLMSVSEGKSNIPPEQFKTPLPRTPKTQPDTSYSQSSIQQQRQPSQPEDDFVSLFGGLDIDQLNTEERDHDVYNQPNAPPQVNHAQTLTISHNPNNSQLPHEDHSAVPQVIVGEADRLAVVQAVAPSSQRAISPEAPITSDGPPQEVLSQCCGDNPREYSATWYYPKDADDFFICTRCYTDHIQSTQFSKEFEKNQQLTHTKRICLFNTPKVINLLWLPAVQSGDLSAFRKHAQNRAKLSGCPGFLAEIFSPLIKWFIPKGNDLDEFFVCEGCYEDRIATSPFEHHFEATTQKPSPPNTWSCAFGNGTVKQSFKLLSAQANGWAQFVEVVNSRRMQLICSSSLTIPGYDGAFRAKRGPKNFLICPACYTDYMGYSNFAHEFEEATDLTKGFSTTCTMNIYSMVVAWNRAEQRGNFDIWLKAAHATFDSPPCLATGIKDSSWYTIKGDDVPELEICPACYAGVIVTQGLEGFFEHLEKSKRGSNPICFLNPAGQYFSRVIEKLQEAVDQKVFQGFAKYAKNIAGMRACQMLEPSEPNLRWFGFKDCTFCPSCWYNHIEGTTLASKATLLGDKPIPEPQVCNIGCDRMLNSWKLACMVQDIDGFKEFAARRRKAYIEIFPQVQELIQRQQVMNATAANYMSQAAFWDQTDITNSVSISGSNTTPKTWDAMSGQYLTSEKIKANECRRMMNQVFAESNKERMYLAQLESQWKEFE